MTRREPHCGPSEGVLSSATMPQVTVGPTTLVSAAKPAVVEVEGREVAIFEVGGRYLAVDNLCPHRDGPLAEGTVEGEVVTCPWHWARFNLATGAVCAPPATSAVRTYAVTVRDGQLVLEV